MTTRRRSPWKIGSDRALDAPDEKPLSPSDIFPARWGRGLLVFSAAFAVLFCGSFLTLHFLPDLRLLDSIGPKMNGPRERSGIIVGGSVIFVGSALAGCLAADPDFRRPTEIVFTAVGLLVICSVSWVNFITDDTLLGWQTQIVLDAIQIIFAVATLSILAGWSPRIDLMKGVRYLASYVISAFALALPLLYGSVAVMKLLGADWFAGDPRMDETVKLLAAILGLPLAAGTVLLPELLRKSR